MMNEMNVHLNKANKEALYNNNKNQHIKFNNKKLHAKR